MRKILIIKLSALGDMALATASFAALRHHHINDHITLLTTALYRDFAQQMGYFDAVIVDPRLKISQWQKLRQFRDDLLAQEFSRVYDLQMVDRTNFYFQGLMSKRRPEWCGTAWGCTYRYHAPAEKRHALEHQQSLLRLVGIETIGIPDLRHLASPTLPIALPSPYALLIPGASVAHTKKCWTQEGYAVVAQFLLEHGIQPVSIGGPQEDNAALKTLCPGVIDLTGQTSFRDIITLASQATVAIGNDTGPLHLAAASYCPVIALFSGRTHPHINGPRNPQAIFIQEADLNDLHPQTVIHHLQKIVCFS